MKLNRFIFIILIGFLFTCSSPLIAQAYQNEPDSFREMKWGTDFETVKDSFVYSHTDPSFGGIEIYTKNEDAMTIGSSTLDKVEYGFWQGQFCLAYIYVSGYSNWSGVHNALTNKFGDGTKTNRYMDKYYWFGNKTFIMSEYREILKTGSFDFTSKEFSDKMEAWSQKKAAEGAKTGF